jgi:hypothetical protein
MGTIRRSSSSILEMETWFLWFTVQVLDTNMLVSAKDYKQYFSHSMAAYIHAK